MATLKKLPIEDLEFSEIIDGNYLYADKTKYLYELLQGTRGAFFLSRPRRFGKTLLLSTLEELFSGDRDRFKGLWIDGSDYSFPRHPVLHLSLSIDPENPADLKRQLSTLLRRIVDANGLAVEPDATYEIYFGNVIDALYRSNNNTRVAVLIDEYDAPVTRRMEDPKVAKANAQVLMAFFSILKSSSVRRCLRFTMVTGITRYALTSMDSGHNHLVDISMDPQYAGICGFAVDEFDDLFGDRMEASLETLKSNNHMKPSASVADLRAEILEWYDGYNWGGDTRILNPLSILTLFKKGRFGPHWIESGRPGHLTALIRARPADFINPKLDSFPLSLLKKTDVENIQPVPVLFHSGYITLDKIFQDFNFDRETMSNKVQDMCSFKLSNYEVKSDYNLDCLDAFFGITLKKPLKDYENCRQAFLARDSKTIGDFFNAHLGTVSPHQRPKGESGFHILVQMLLQGMGFKVLTEMPGSAGRLDLCVELPNEVSVIIELKFFRNPKALGAKKKNEVLAELAWDHLSQEEVDQSLAELAKRKLNQSEILKITRKFRAGLERDEHLALAATENLPKVDIDAALASALERKLGEDEIDALLDMEAPGEPLSDEQIESKLTAAAQKALDAINGKNYRAIVALHAKEIICLGMAMYGSKPKIKALFDLEATSP